MALNLNTIKQGVGVAAAVGSLFKKDKPMTAAVGRHGSFTSAIKTYGISRPNKFSVIMTMPGIVGPAKKRILSLYAIDVEIPNREIYTEKSRIYGTSVEMPIDYQYGLTFNMTFYVDVAYRNVSAISDWMGVVVDPKSNDIEYLNNYAGTIVVNAMDFSLKNGDALFKKPSMVDSVKRSFMQSFDPNNEKYDDPLAEFVDQTTVEYKFIGAYPKSMQVKKLSNNSQEYQEVTVTFAYTTLVPTYKFAGAERVLPKLPSGKQSFVDKLLGNVTSKVSGFASTAGGVTGSIANIARIGG